MNLASEEQLGYDNFDGSPFGPLTVRLFRQRADSDLSPEVQDAQERTRRRIVCRKRMRMPGPSDLFGLGSREKRSEGGDRAKDVVWATRDLQVLTPFIQL